METGSALTRIRVAAFHVVVARTFLTYALDKRVINPAVAFRTTFAGETFITFGTETLLEENGFLDAVHLARGDRH